MKKGIGWIIVLGIALGVGGFYGWNYYQTSQKKISTASAQTSTQMVKIQKGSINAFTSATGTTRSGQSGTLTWQTTGTIASISVKVGDVVKKDQVLATLDPNTVSTNINQAKIDIINYQQQLDTLKTSKTNLVTAQKAVADAQTAYDTAQKTRTNLDYGRGSKDQIDAARAGYLLAQDKLKHQQDIYGGISGDPTQDVRKANALAMLNSALAARDKALANLNWYLGTNSKTDIATADLNVALAQAKLEDAKRALDLIKANGYNPNDAAVLQAKINASQSTINQANLTAPFDGTITLLNSKVGDLVSGSTQALRLDDLSALYVDLSVSEIDINRIAVGQNVTLTYDAITGKTYRGKVTQVGAVGVSTQGAVNYTVTLQLANADAAVRTGMSASANILTTQINNVLVAPNKSIRVSGQNHIVYIMQDGKATPVTVKTGASSDTLTEITSDTLQEGDEILLNPPATTTNRTATGGAGAIIDIPGGGIPGGGVPGGGGFRPGN